MGVGVVDQWTLVSDVHASVLAGDDELMDEMLEHHSAEVTLSDKDEDAP